MFEGDERHITIREYILIEGEPKMFPANKS